MLPDKELNNNTMRKWTREEALLALYAYCQIPFNKASNCNPIIVRIANAIKRTPAAVKMKIGNFGSFDPYLRSKGIVGLSGTSQIDKAVWNEFYGQWDRLSVEAEKLLLYFESTYDGIGENEILYPEGYEIDVVTRTRINQDFFRHSVLSSYNNTCCITKISCPQLLEAAHIIAWNEDPVLRTNPTNGLCLNPLCHKAFDKFLISISPDYTLYLSSFFINSLEDDSLRRYFMEKEQNPIILPDRFLPNPEYLNIHFNKFVEQNEITI